MAIRPDNDKKAPTYDNVLEQELRKLKELFGEEIGIAYFVYLHPHAIIENEIDEPTNDEMVNLENLATILLESLKSGQNQKMLPAIMLLLFDTKHRNDPLQVKLRELESQSAIY